VILFEKGLSIKDARTQEGLSSVDIFRTKEKGWGLQMRSCGRPHFLAQKTSDFFEIGVCLHGQSGVEPVRTGEGVNFSRFRLMDGPKEYFICC